MQNLSEALSGSFGFSELPVPLFYGCDHALRFDLGGEISAHADCILRFVQALDRARTVTSHAFGKTSEFTVAMTAWSGDRKGNILRSRRKSLTRLGFSPAVWQKQPSTEIDEGYWSHVATAVCPAEQENLTPLLWASIARELAIEPSVDCRIHLIDFARGIIVHAYDDRGMDIAASERTLLLPLYDTFNDWLLDYDRPAMARVFGRRARL